MSPVVSTAQLLLFYVTAWILAGIILSRRRSERIEASPLVIAIKMRKRFESFDKLRGSKVVGLFLDLGILSVFVLMFLFYKMLVERILLLVSGRPAGAAPIVPLIPGLSIDIRTFLYLLPGLGIAVIAHEVMHALAARYSGIDVKYAGFLVFLGLLPAAFVEPDEDELRKAPLRARLRVYSAGVLANVVLWLLLLAAMKPLVANGYYMYIVNIAPNSFAQEYGLKRGVLVKAIYINNSGPLDITRFEEAMIKLRNENGGTIANITLIIVFQLINNTNVTVVKKAAPPNIQGKERLRYDRIGIYFTAVPKSLVDIGLSANAAYTLFVIILFTELINIGLAAINAAPLFITDGARVVQDTLARILRDEQRATILTNMISLLTLLLVIPNIKI